MFIINWMFDKLGYMPKIDMQVGVVKNAWPFPGPEEKKKPVAKKTPTVAKKATRKPAAKKAK
jgi:hypothetical protein